MKLLLIYLSVLLFGVIGYTSFKKTADKKSLYLKFLSFALVALFTYALLDQQSNYTLALYSIISALALYELIKTCRPVRAASVYILTGGITLLLFVYTGLVPAFPHSKLFLCALSFDAFSQFFGQIFGRHALTRKISPNKTIEGCAGGLLMCMLTSFFMFHSVWKGLYISFFALSGDLLASFVKRRAGVKDFSRLLPGQGGVLDRFDSYILSAVFYLPLL
jgi:phosphatidate cytidylyltransferase